MTGSQTFEIEGTFPNLNDYTGANRSNRYAGSKMKRECQRRVCDAIRASGLEPVEGRADIHFTWVERNMRRDKDNIRFAAKFVLDALVECGILANDDWGHVGGLSDSFMVNAKNPRVIVTISTEGASDDMR